MPADPPRPIDRKPIDQKQAVRDQFGPVAAHYASADVHRAGADLDALVAAAEARGDERVLDVGCGAGHTALALAPHVAHVDALDLTPGMLDQVHKLAAERGVANVSTRLGDAEAIPAEDRRYGIVTCRLCAHHFQRPGRALAEMFRVLAPGGRLLLVDIVAPEPAEVDTFLNAIELVRDPSHVRDHSLAEWRAMLGAAGFDVRSVHTWPMRIDFPAWLARIGATEDAAAALRLMFGRATALVRARMEIDPERLDFTLTNGLLVADRMAG